ncbi:hypothetical protein MT349_17605 [Rathayibacter caricis]|uniref:hypothetical protein n=1 Tax=Rathayibacter caricis TaxID=110936 RepID=UPI001FB20865|nr:hypothetical protein [Rathayibacter caricis]MCJ1697601.1 hypothetical protein [Rathayibacter caricis]
MSDGVDIAAGLVSPDPRETIFLTGAGISVDPPSCGPSGIELTFDAMTTFFEDGAWKKVTKALRIAGAPDGVPRLETILDVVMNSYPPDVVGPFLRDRLDVPPNPNHYLFAEHCFRGGRHVTANVDTAIETAYAQAYQDTPETILHLHRSLDAGTGFDKIGLSLPVIENGLAPDIAAELDQILLNKTARTLVVAGYSSSDYFDVIPYLADRAPRMTHLSVVWLDYAKVDKGVQVLQQTDSATSTVKLLRSAGVEVTVIVGPTAAILAGIGLRWMIDAPPVNFASRANPPQLLLDPVTRSRATILLYAQLGMPGALRDLRHRHPDFVDATTAVSFAEAEWDAGRYREVARLWATAGDDSPEWRWRRVERAAACDWIMGRYVKARRTLVRALTEMAVEQPPPPPDVRLVVADTLVRVLEQMSQLPDTRWIPKRRARERAAAALDGLEGVPRDLRLRLRSARAKLNGTVDLSNEASESHLQSSSVSRTLAYRGGALRNRDRQGELIPASEFRELRGSWECVGGLGSGGRMVTIPGFWPAYTLCECCKIVFDSRVDATHYHRVRVFLIVIAGRVLRRLRRLTAPSPARARPG